MVKEKILKASEWGMEFGISELDFLWWDTNEGLINKRRFLQIKKQIGR